MHQVFALSSLSAIARHQDVGFRHDLTQYLSHFRIGCAYNGSDIAVGTSHALLAPFIHLLTYQLIERTSVDQLILKFSAGRIGCFYQDEKAFLFFLAYLHKGLYTVRSQIRVDRHKILIERCVSIASHLYFSDMSCCVSRRSRSDVSALDIANDYQPLLLTVIHSLFKRHKPRDPKLLVHRNLRLHCRDQIIGLVHNFFIELPDGLRCSFQRLAVLCIRFFLYMLRHIAEHRV